MHTKSFLAALLAPAAVSAQLHDLALRAGLKYFGTAIREGATSNDAAYMAIINNKSEFGSVVPENGQKWDATEPQRGQFTYASGDITANIAKRNGQSLRCHTLVWHSQLPNWGMWFLSLKVFGAASPCAYHSSQCPLALGPGQPYNPSSRRTSITSWATT